MRDCKHIAELAKNGCANEVEEEELIQKKSRLNVCINADYQHAKLIPHWNYSDQPGTTYYKQTLSNDILAIVFHTESVDLLYAWRKNIPPYHHLPGKMSAELIFIARVGN